MALRIGCGAGFGGDRIDPAADLANRGELDFLVFECVAERTLALGHLARMRDPDKGYNAHLQRRLRAVLPGCVANRTCIVTNMGVANPRAAGRAAARVADELGLRGLKIAVIEGDDVTAAMSERTVLPEIGRTIGETGLRLVGANAYLGADVIAAALNEEPDIVLTGRVADPSLVVAPAAHRLGWAFDDWRLMAAGTLVGHLLECGALVTGGYFADPGYKSVPDLAYLGYPLAEISADGSAVITKLPRTGGSVTAHTVKEQLFYEVHDPRSYMTPDVIADFASTRIASDGRDRVAVAGAKGRPRPDMLKVTVGFDGGFLAEAELSYAGAGAGDRGKLAAEIVQERMRNLHGCRNKLRVDLIGVTALHSTAERKDVAADDVRLRAALRTADRETAELLLFEVEALYNTGPAGGGGLRGSVTPSVVTQSTLVERASIEPSIEMVVT
jgi:hypothetical protein